MSKMATVERRLKAFGGRRTWFMQSKREHLNETANQPTRDVDAIRTLRALNRWMSFTERLDEKDRVLLDRLAIGEELKVAAAVADISYACAQKRIVRHVSALGVANASQLTSAWRKFNRKSRVIAEETPTVLLYADRIGEIVSKDELPRAAE
jgi:hypothetical protein